MSGRGKLCVPVDRFRVGRNVNNLSIKIQSNYIFTNTENHRGGCRMLPLSFNFWPKKKRDRGHRSFACLQFATWRHMAPPGFSPWRSPKLRRHAVSLAHPTRSIHHQAASATNLLCPSKGRIDGSNPGEGRRSLVAPADVAKTPRRSESSCCSPERHDSPDGYHDTSPPRGSLAVRGGSYSPFQVEYLEVLRPRCPPVGVL